MNLLAINSIQDCARRAQQWIDQNGAGNLRESLTRLTLDNLEGQLPEGTDHSPFHLPVVMPILNAAAENDLFALARKCVQLIYRTARQNYGFVQLAQKLNWSADMIRTLLVDDVNAEHAINIGRPDILFHKGHPVFLELNLDCAVGGKMKASRTLRGFQSLEYMRSQSLSVREPLAALHSLITSAGGNRLPVRTALLDYSSDAYVRQIERRLLDRDGVQIEFVSVDQAGLSFESFDVIVKCCEIAPDLSKLDFQTRESLLDQFDRCPQKILSNGVSTLLSNKLILALAMEATEESDPGAHEFFSLHLPWSKIVRPGPVIFHGEKVELTELLLPQHRSQFVLKAGFGWAGNDVLWGGECGEEKWSTAIKSAFSSNGAYLVQEFLKPDHIELPFLTELGNVEFESVIALFGPYLFGSNPCGTLLSMTRNATVGMVGPRFRSVGLPTFTINEESL